MTPEAVAAPVDDASWAQRLDGLVPEEIGRQRVLIAGCGSVGSFVADELCRLGVSDFTLVDPDHVEWPNLSRTVYCHADVGVPKVEALAGHLRAIRPDLRVAGHACELQAFGPGLRELLEGVDLVVGAVDDPRASGILDRFCYALGIPCLFIGLYRGAKGGEAIAVHPRFTPCMACATGGVREALADVVDTREVVRPRYYGTYKLQAEIALGCDIHFVCAAAVKLALAILALEHEALPVSRFLRERLEQRSHYVIFGMEPNYFLFPSTHAGAAGQHAFQSLWLQTTSRPDCTRCGSAEFREPPF